jgi:hypothetical protein
MAQYCVSGVFLAGNTFANNIISNQFPPLVEFATTPTDQPVITELGIGFGADASNISTNFWLGIAPVRGVGGYLVPQVSGAYDAVSAISNLQVYTAWQKPPTVPAHYLRGFRLPNISGLGIAPAVLRLGRGLKLNASQSLVVYGQPGVSGRPIWGEYWVEFDE